MTSISTHTETIILGTCEETGWMPVVVCRVITDSELPGRYEGFNHAEAVAVEMNAAIRGGWLMSELSTSNGDSFLYV